MGQGCCIDLYNSAKAEQSMLVIVYMKIFALSIKAIGTRWRSISRAFVCIYNVNADQNKTKFIDINNYLLRRLFINCAVCPDFQQKCTDTTHYLKHSRYATIFLSMYKWNSQWKHYLWFTSKCYCFTKIECHSFQRRRY